MPSGVPKRGESLADLFPAVAAQWHPTKNGDLTPWDVTTASNKKHWWKCDIAADHEWEAIVNNRISKRSGCPMCAGRLASVTNSVESLFPELVAEWHPEKNDVLPNQVTSTSHKKIWWKCPKGSDHEWLSECRTRTGSGHGGGGYGCPFCDGKRTSVTNSLQSLFPNVSAEWHPTKNGDIVPSDVVAGSNQKVWWLCGEGPDHQWSTSPKKRTYGQQSCPFCAHVKLSVTNSLQAVAPEVADLWHPTKNGDLSPEKVIAGANKKIWWKCPEGPDHEWEATANSLVSAGSRCPCCAHQKLSVTNSLSTLYPNVAAEWHPTKNGDLTPDQVIAGTHKRVWWQCLAVSGHEWSIPILNRTANGSGCPDCTLTPRSAPEMRLAHELTALINLDLEAHKLRFAGRLRDVDILIEDLKLVVEFDGAYWHRNKGEKDLKKTEQIENEGWKVIRVRERPLESIHTNDVMVEPLTPVKEVANLVFKQIEKVAKTKIPNLKKYLTSEEPWREEEALTAIRAYQAERAAAKAERAAKKAARSE